MQDWQLSSATLDLVTAFLMTFEDSVNVEVGDGLRLQQAVGGRRNDGESKGRVETEDAVWLLSGGLVGLGWLERW